MMVSHSFGLFKMAILRHGRKGVDTSAHLAIYEYRYICAPSNRSNASSSSNSRPPDSSDKPSIKKIIKDSLDSLKSSNKMDTTDNIVKSVVQESSQDIVRNVKKKAVRVPLDLSVSSLERNFVTPGRAMSDFLLKMEHLEGLRATKRRSPYINQPPITVYWRKDVEEKAIQVWGSKEKLLKELLRQQLERKFQEQSNVTLKRQLRSSRKESLLLDQNEKEYTGPDPRQGQGLRSGSGRVVLSAIAINATNFAMKAVAWMYTGSHSMFAECVHSLADTCNQLILAYGIHKSVQRANSDHPYGYTNMKYVSSLISGVGVFCVGTGLSLYHGVMGLVCPIPMESFYWAFVILGGSLISEGATLVFALSSVMEGARKGKVSVKEYIARGTDPSVNVVLLEDCAAVLSIIVTGSFMGLTSYYDTPVPDAVGSLLVGGILGAVASFIIYTNVTALVGRSIQQAYLDRINYELESDVMVRGIHDVKGIDMGNSLIRYKAEIDFDGRELTRAYLDHQDLPSLFEEVKSMKSIDEFEGFLLKHSESIIDRLGGEIDRIEVKLRTKFPEIRHCDLEVL